MEHQEQVIGRFIETFVRTRLGSGCTSGHGVCGISRFSLRSIIATIIFMLFGILTAYFTLHYLGS